MPEWVKAILGDMTAIQLIFWVVAIFALIGLTVKLWPAIRHTVEVVEAFRKLPEFVETVKTTRDSLDDAKKQISEIHHEVHYNNGTSVKDATRRIEMGVKGLYEKIESTEETLVSHIEDADEWKDRLARLEDTQPNPNKEERN